MSPGAKPAATPRGAIIFEATGLGIQILIVGDIHKVTGKCRGTDEKRDSAHGSLSGAIFHSDHGSVYTSQAFRDHCALLGLHQSMGAVGTSVDNALAGSLNATLK